jgi:hypothetical protein
MPLIYLGTGWFIGIALASALHLPIEFLLPAFLVPVIGLLLWKGDHRARLIWISLILPSAAESGSPCAFRTSIRILFPPTTTAAWSRSKE